MISGVAQETAYKPFLALLMFPAFLEPHPIKGGLDEANIVY